MRLHGKKLQNATKIILASSGTQKMPMCKITGWENPNGIPRYMLVRHFIGGELIAPEFTDSAEHKNTRQHLILPQLKPGKVSFPFKYDSRNKRTCNIDYSRL